MSKRGWPYVEHVPWAGRQKITGLLTWIVTLLAIAVVVTQGATAQESPLPNAQAYINRGTSFMNKGDNDRAIDDFNQAIQRDPNFALAYLSLGVAYRNKGDNVRAIENFNVPIRLDPKNALAYFNRGLAYQSKGYNDRAIADFNQAIQLDPKSASGPTRGRAAIRLYLAYVNYSYLQLCNQVRQGYAITYINDDELQRARVASKAIEKAALRDNPNIDLDKTFAEADKHARTMYVNRDGCRTTLTALLNASPVSPYQTQRP